MKDLKAIRGKYYLERVIAEGEHERQDFKFAISDARKIARSLSAFANNSGGQLLIGVKDNGVIAGVRTEEDIYLIEQAAQMYCRPAQRLEITAFMAEGGATVVRVRIDASHSRPVQALDTDGRWKAYYRVADENILATPLMVRAWRKTACGNPASISIGQAENAVLQTIKTAAAPVDIEDIVRQSHISLQTTERILTDLYAIGVIGFTFRQRRFMVTAKDLSEEE